MIPELEEDVDPIHKETGVELRQRPSFRDNLRSNGRFLRRFALGAAVALTALGGVFFWGRSQSRPLPPSTVGTAPTLEELPGTGDAVYQEHLAAADRRRAAEAQSAGTSAVPTPPVVRPSPLAELQQRSTQQASVEAQPTNSKPPEKPDNSHIVKAIADVVAARRQPIMTVSQRQETASTAPAAAAQTAPAAAPVQQTAQPLVGAGRVLYGRTTIMATTEAPGLVLAEVLSAPLTGATLIGNFQATDNGMVLSFNQLSLPGQPPRSISALAVDPQTTSYNVADDVDRRLWSRLILPSAAAFVSGLGTALSQPRVGLTVGSSYVVTERSESTTQQAVAAGLGTAAGSVSQMLQQQGASNNRPIITTNANREIGILFLTPIEATR